MERMLRIKYFDLLKFSQLLNCKAMIEILVQLQIHAFLPRQVVSLYPNDEGMSNRMLKPNAKNDSIISLLLPSQIMQSFPCLLYYGEQCYISMYHSTPKSVNHLDSFMYNLYAISMASFWYFSFQT